MNFLDGLLLLCVFVFLVSLFGILKTNVASTAFTKTMAAVDTIDGHEDTMTAINLIDSKYAYSDRVILNPFGWSTKHHYPDVVEYLESMGIEVK